MHILSNSLFQDKEKNIRCLDLAFDGAHSSVGLGAGIVLILPDKGVTCFSYKMEFDCTNNISEYQALVLGLNLTIDMNIRYLHVKGDSYLIISQVKRNFSAKKPRLRKYKDVVWDAIKSFEEFSIESIPREENSMTDAFAISSSTLQPCEEILPYKVEVKFRPSTSNILEHWQVFDDEKSDIAVPPK
jgi:ribonuclease HI